MADDQSVLPAHVERISLPLITGPALFLAWGFLSFLSPSLIGPFALPSVHSDYAYFVSQVVLIVTVAAILFIMHRREMTLSSSFLIVMGTLLTLSTAAVAIVAAHVAEPGLFMPFIGIVVGATSPFIGIAWGARYSLEGPKAFAAVALSFIVSYLIYFAGSRLAFYLPLASSVMTVLLPLLSVLIWYREARGRQVLTQAVWPVRGADGTPETPGELLAGSTSFALLPMRMISILAVVALIGNLLPSIVYEYRWDLVAPVSYGGFLLATVFAVVAFIIMLLEKLPMTLVGSLRLMLPVSSIGLTALLVFGEPAEALSCALVFGSGLFLQLIVYVKMTEVTQRRGFSPMLTFGVGQAIVATAVIVGNIAGKVGLRFMPSDAQGLLMVMAGLSVLLLIFGLVFLFKWEEPAVQGDDTADMQADAHAELAQMAERVSEDGWDLAVHDFADSLGCTKREGEVLGHLLRGHSVPYAAQQMYITTGTAKTHVNHIYQKAGVNSRQQLLDLYEETFRRR